MTVHICFAFEAIFSACAVGIMNASMGWTEMNTYMQVVGVCIIMRREVEWNVCLQRREEMRGAGRATPCSSVVMILLGLGRCDGILLPVNEFKKIFV